MNVFAPPCTKVALPTKRVALVLAKALALALALSLALPLALPLAQTKIQARRLLSKGCVLVWAVSPTKAAP